jgi:diguanylate cyclase (GGDEF)-like protein
MDQCSGGTSPAHAQGFGDFVHNASVAGAETIQAHRDRSIALNHLIDFADLVGAAAPTALLLWLSAQLLSRLRAEGDASSNPLALTILGLATAGLWWPLHLGWMQAAGALGTVLAIAGAAALAVVIALTGAAVAVSGPWHSGRRWILASMAWMVASASISIAGLAADGAGLAWAARCLVGAAVLTGSLMLLAWPQPLGMRDNWWRKAAAVGAGLAASAAPGAMAASPWASAGVIPTLGLVLVGCTVLVYQRRTPLRTRVSVRAAAAAAEPAEDALTGLPTRTRFEARLERAVLECDASNGRLALMFVDLDGFKPVNDTFGHASGDRVLRTVGQRLRAATESQGDLVARVGGDEFLVLMTTGVSQDAAALRARQFVQALSRPFEVDGRQVSISCSIGIAFYPDGGAPAKLIARADAAMYAAKRAGGAGFSFFSPSMEDDARDRFDLLRDLRTALERKELELYYQPKIDAATGKVTAAEALLRWQHPTRGMVPPATFIPIAERFGLIREIGNWVIEDACRQARVWQDRGLRMRVAINLSAVQMRQEDIVARIEGALARHRVEPARLTCEITESVAMEDTRATQATFRELGAAGIHLSIDDFGTGYSSLAYLRKLPAEELKIDRSFITDVEHSADARAVIDAVLKLAHALGLKVVAEGIENERQRDILTELGCDELQGFLFAKPMTARALLLWAMDDHREHETAFASSLFVSTVRAHLGEPITHALH